MKIEKAIYEGYLWMSDATYPLIIDEEEYEIELNDLGNPFIIEGFLFNRNKNESISIKYVDGAYLTQTYDLNKIASDTVKEEIKFVPNRMPKIKALKFIQYWRPSPDEFCENMEVLQAKELIFVGFEK